MSNLIPIRILRAQVETLIDLRATWRPAQFEREKAILRLATAMIATHGMANVTLPGLARAMAISTNTFRRYFVDLEALVGAILRRHLEALYEALAEIPANTPNIAAARRQKWLQLTRTENGDFTDAHKIFVLDRHLLPADILPALEELYAEHGSEIAAPATAGQALAVIDQAFTTQASVEAALTASAAKPEPPRAPHPATPPRAAEILLNPAFIRRATAAGALRATG